MELIAALALLLGVSVLGNVGLYFQWKHVRACLKASTATFAAELEKARKAPAPTLSAEELLHQMTTQGSAIVRIECLNPADLFLRSPRR